MISIEYRKRNKKDHLCDSKFDASDWVHWVAFENKHCFVITFISLSKRSIKEKFQNYLIIVNTINEINHVLFYFKISLMPTCCNFKQFDI